MNRIWTSEQMKTALLLNEEGRTSREIGAVIGKSPRAVKEWLYRRMNGNCDTRIVPEGFAERAWESNRSLMRDFNASPATIKRWRTEIGVPASRRRPLLTKEEIEPYWSTLSMSALRKKFKLSDTTLRKIAKMYGLPSKVWGPVPVPDDFMAVARDKTIQQICKHYACSWDTAKRWIAESGIKRDLPKVESPNRLAIPPKFYEVAHRLSNPQLAKMFGVSTTTISRFRKEARIAAPHTAAVSRPPSLIRMISSGGNGSTVSMAATYLRRFCPVAQVKFCDRSFRDKYPLSHYVVGRMVLSPDEVIDLAKRKGWNPDAWRQIAA